MRPGSPSERVRLAAFHRSKEDHLHGRAAVPLTHVHAGADSAHVFEGTSPMESSGNFAYGVRVRARTEREYCDSLRDLVLWA